MSLESVASRFNPKVFAMSRDTCSLSVWSLRRPLGRTFEVATIAKYLASTAKTCCSKYRECYNAPPGNRLC